MTAGAASLPMQDADQCEPLIGLATLARAAYQGGDLRPLGAVLLERAQRNPGDANALMDLSTVLHLTGNRELGLAVQEQALALRRVFRLAAGTKPAGMRLLLVVSPGDLAENNAVEFLVEGTDVTLEMLYIAPGEPLPARLPEHDLAFIAVSEYDRNRTLLASLERAVAGWPRPVLNAPQKIARLSREGACELLKSVRGVVAPKTVRVGRSELEQIGCGQASVAALLDGHDFPIIVRPVDSHKGQGLARLDTRAAAAGYLHARPEPAFYIAPFIDYRGPDGLCRKYRILLIAGKPYACHMAISEQWMVHYVNAGMAESAAKQAEEERFMVEFDDGFARRHAAALRDIAERVDVEYVGFDCGETPTGELLIFEADTGMTVHAMDAVERFPYKHVQMRKVFRAFRDMLAAAARR